MEVVPLCLPFAVRVEHLHAVVLALKGEVLARLGTTPGGFLPGQFTTPHGIAVDSQGNIYIGELSGRYWPRFSKGPVPEQRRVIHRLRKITA
jgi:hypothetical protein